MSGLDITGGRVLDPGRGIDATATVSIADGIITGVDALARVEHAAAGDVQPAQTSPSACSCLSVATNAPAVCSASRSPCAAPRKPEPWNR